MLRGMAWEKKRVLGIAVRVFGGLLLAGALAFFTVAPGLVERARNRVHSDEWPPVSARATELHARLLVTDLHSDSLLWDRDLLERSTRGHVDLPRLEAANVAIQAFTVVTSVPFRMRYQGNDGRRDAITPLFVAQLRGPRAWHSLEARALSQAESLRETVERSEGRMILLRRKADLEDLLRRRSAGERVTGVLLGLEGSQALEGDLAAVDRLFEAGFRMMAPVHFTDNEVGGSAHGLSNEGLSNLGNSVLKRQEALGIAVDVAHGSVDLIDDVLDQATKPVVVSHTGVRGTCDNPRNLSDAQIRRVGASGGVVAIGFFEAAICGRDAAAIARAVRHAVRVAGVEHVALGSDFDGAVTVPFDVTGLPHVTEALLAAGLDEASVAAVMGGNTVRVLRALLPE